MRFVCKLRRMAIALSFAATASLADAISVESLAGAGTWVRDDHLREMSDILLYGQGSFIDVGMYYTPLPSQIPLKSEFGEHQGFAFRHHFAGFSSTEISKGYFLGLLLWFDRYGWDGEDFFFFPRYSDFGHVSSVTTWGISFTDAKHDWTVAAGMQHQNLEFAGDFFPAENDSLLYTWAELRYWKFSAQASLHRANVKSLRLSMNLEDRAVYGGASSGFRTYLPNIDATIYKRVIRGFDEDFLRVHWEQNLFDQRLYAEVSYDFPDDGFHSAALKYYPDPSRLVGIEFTCLRRRVYDDGWDDLMFGWAIELPVLRIGYNSATDYDRLFHAKGTWIAELQFNLQSVGEFLFGRGGRTTAPIETNTVKQKNKQAAPQNSGITLPTSLQTQAPLTATGVRYEKVDAGATQTQGGR